MGWQDRDYAKLREDELEALYSFRKPTPPRTLSTRRVVWTLVAIASTAVFGFGWTQRQVPPPAQQATPAPSALYGIAMHDDTFGEGVCTDLVFRDGLWRCNSIEFNVRNVPVIRATPYNGPCGHLTINGSHWVCVEAGPALPPALDSFTT